MPELRIDEAAAPRLRELRFLRWAHRDRERVVVRHLSFVICHLSFVICHSSLVIRHWSFVARKQMANDE